MFEISDKSTKFIRCGSCLRNDRFYLVSVSKHCFHSIIVVEVFCYLNCHFSTIFLCFLCSWCAPLLLCTLTNCKRSNIIRIHSCIVVGRLNEKQAIKKTKYYVVAFVIGNHSPFSSYFSIIFLSSMSKATDELDQAMHRTHSC